MQRYYIFCICQTFLTIIFEKMLQVPVLWRKSVSREPLCREFRAKLCYTLTFFQNLTVKRFLLGVLLKMIDGGVLFLLFSAILPVTGNNMKEK